MFVFVREGKKKSQKMQTNQVLTSWTINFNMSALGQGNRLKKDAKVMKLRDFTKSIDLLKCILLDILLP